MPGGHGKMKRTIHLLVVLTFALLLLACEKAERETSTEEDSSKQAQTATEGVTATDGEEGWYLDWDAALETAAKEKRPVLAYFEAPWCKFCELMDAETFSSVEIGQTLASEWIAIRLDIDDKSAQGSYRGERLTYAGLAERFGIRALPSFVFLDTQGDPIRVISGYNSKQRFGLILEYMGKQLYKDNVDLDAYIATRSSSTL
jgi:thioredoxin-related protein